MINFNRTCAQVSPLILAVVATLSATLAAVLIAYNTSFLFEWHLMSLGSVSIMMPVILDPLSLLYLSVVLFISSNVLQFSKFYMLDDQFINRFTILVLLFVLSMGLLIFIPSLMMLLLGWDGLGITSFILVIYYQNPKSLAAGMITALTNRVGDVMILMAIALSINQGHWSMFSMWDSSFSTLVILFIMVAGMTKSAQMPFSSWLPAAMAAPTPVSALVHSSTLVTAGVFLLIRFYPFLSTLPLFNSILLFSAISTMLMAGISAATECDMKKIIALSTLSQLGMMMTSLGLGAPTFALLHMMTHAMFKALLFICAGEMIALHSHGQDLRWLGNLVTQAPVASSCALIANMALCGLPFLAGFYSKDLIMEVMISNNTNWFMILLTFLAVGFTSFYSIRFTMCMFLCARAHMAGDDMSESPKVVLPMILMSAMSITCGASLLWLLPMNHLESVLPIQLKLLPLYMVIIGGSLGWLLTNKLTSNLMQAPLSNNASCSMWFLVPLSSQFQMAAPFTLGHNLMKSCDHGWLETVGSQGVNITITKIGTSILSTGPMTPPALLTKCLMAGIVILMATTYMM
nr:NADH dehydrogenase subunit 5 [Tubifex tubifex]